jgi:hypothetical protein
LLLNIWLSLVAVAVALGLVRGAAVRAAIVRLPQLWQKAQALAYQLAAAAREILTSEAPAERRLHSTALAQQAAGAAGAKARRRLQVAPGEVDHIAVPVRQELRVKAMLAVMRRVFVRALADRLTSRVRVVVVQGAQASLGIQQAALRLALAVRGLLGLTARPTQVVAVVLFMELLQGQGRALAVLVAAGPERFFMVVAHKWRAPQIPAVAVVRQIILVAGPQVPRGVRALLLFAMPGAKWQRAAP